MASWRSLVVRIGRTDALLRQAQTRQTAGELRKGVRRAAPGMGGVPLHSAWWEQGSRGPAEAPCRSRIRVRVTVCDGRPDRSVPASGLRGNDDLRDAARPVR